MSASSSDNPYPLPLNPPLADEALFAYAFSAAAIGMALVAPDGRFLKVNPSLCELLGYDEAQLLELDFQTITHPDDLATDESYVAQMLAGSIDTYRMEKRYLTRSGAAVWIELSVSLVRDAKDQPLHFISQIQNIDQQKRLEHQLRREYTINRVLLELESSLHQAKDIGSLCEHGLNSLAKLLPELTNSLVWSYDSEHEQLVLAAATHQPAAGGDDPALLALLQELLVRQSPHRWRGDEAPGPLRDTLQITDTASLLILPVLKDQAAQGLLALVLPPGQVLSMAEERLAMTLSKRLAHLLAAQRHQEISERQFKRIRLMNEITTAIGRRLDLHSIYQVIVRELQSQLPADVACLRQVRTADCKLMLEVVACRCVHDVPQICNAPQELSESGLELCLAGDILEVTDTQASDNLLARLMAANGLRSLLALPLRVENETLAVLQLARRQPAAFSASERQFLVQLSQHISLATQDAKLYHDLQQAYDQLQTTQQTMMQQERLKALGQMAAGIAHDINNTLSPVTGYTDLLLTRADNLTVKQMQYLRSIQAAAKDIGHTVANMREFYRQRQRRDTLTAVDLSDLVRQALRLAAPRLRDLPQARGITIDRVTDLANDLPPMEGNETELRESLLNLFFNAIDAMPEGGTLTIRTLAADGQVMVKVRDSGIGMDEETRTQCLEPFFSTKGELGSGLGLATVYGTVQRHRGSCEITSTPGRGSTFCLCFPATTAPRQPSSPAAPLAPAERSRHILCIDDESMVRELVVEMLSVQGHQATPAEHGREALELFRQALEGGEAFDLVITDLGMPYLDGIEVSRQIKEMSPTTPVVLLSGWGNRLQGEREIPPEIDRVISKPPTLAQLAEVIESFD